MVAFVILLAIVGVAAGSLRAARAWMGVTRPGAAAAFDSGYLDFFFASTPLQRQSPRGTELEENFIVGERKYDAHPVATLLHVVPGVLFMILGPLQLIPGIRARRPALHRWSGRVLLVAGSCIAGSGLFISWVAPIAGIQESVLITVVATFFLVAGTQAWLAIRQGRRAVHREWMLRFLAAGLAISTARLISVPLEIGLPVSFTTAFMIAVTGGWAVTLGAAEWWIRRTRVPVPRALPLEPVAVYR